MRGSDPLLLGETVSRETLRSCWTTRGLLRPTNGVSSPEISEPFDDALLFCALRPIRTNYLPDPRESERLRRSTRFFLDDCDPLARSFRMPTTTVVGGSITPTPHRRTSRSIRPRRDTAMRSRSISSGADDPLIATSRPPGRISGADHDAKRSSGATARDVTTSARPTSARTARSSARPLTTVTSSPRDVTTSSRNVVRRSNGSTSVMRRSGRANASGIPGRPAPLPMSMTYSPSAITSPRTPEFTMCRSHKRGTSRGPIRPRVMPSVASISRYRIASSSRSLNTAWADGGGEGSAPPSGAALSLSCFT